MIDGATCMFCERRYRGNSMPWYMTNADGVIVGTAHRSCANRNQDHMRLIWVASCFLPVAQRWAYSAWWRTTHDDAPQLLWHVSHLFAEHDGDDAALAELTDTQRELAAGFPVSLPILMTAYRQFVADYLAWKADHYPPAASPVVPLVDQYHALLMALTADEFAPWSWGRLSEGWECAYCDGAGQDSPDDPRDNGHAPTCPFLVARRLVQAEEGR